MKKLKEMELFDEILKGPSNKLTEQAIAEGRHAIGYNCYTTPVPLLECGNLFPVRLRGSWLESTEDSDFYLGAWTCSYSHAILQAMIAGDFDYLDGILGTYSCVQMQRAIQHEGILKLDEKKSSSKPYFYDMIDMPRKLFDPSLRRAALETRRVAAGLSELFGTDVSDEALRETIVKHNEFNALLRSISDMRKEENPRITGGEWHRVFAASLCAPRDLLVEPLKELKAALEERKPDKERLPRLMIFGNSIDNPRFIDVIEEQGCVVVADRFCYGSLPGMEDIPVEGDPYENIVRHYLTTTECPRMMEDSLGRFDYLMQLIDDYKVDGAMFQVLKFCDLWNWEVLTNFKRLQEAGVQGVRVEREYLISDEGQLSTRAQALVERLRAKAMR